MSPDYWYDVTCRRFFVSQGISSGPRAPWMAMYQKAPFEGGVHRAHRLNSPSLPLRQTEADAQRDLDEYAAVHGFWKMHEYVGGELQCP